MFRYIQSMKYFPTDLRLDLRLRRAILAAAAVVVAASFPLRAEEIATVAGPLTIVAGFETAVSGMVVLLDGAPILKDPEMALASVEKAFPEGANSRILVLGVSTGGNACPLLLRLIDVGRKPPVVSRRFGTCYDEVEVLQARDGSVRIVQPNPNGKGHSRWIYRNGVLSGP